MNWKAIALLTSMAAGVPATAQQATLKGIEVSDLDRSVKPCDDFYDYANGAWRAQNPIPASMDRWSRRWKAGEDNNRWCGPIRSAASSGSLISAGKLK